MKLLHIGDLHIGKKVKGFSLIEDQKHVLKQITEVVAEKEVNGIIIAGDIYDTSIPNIDAINLFDEFISEIHELGVACYIVSGNHDNIYRVTFGSKIMSKENIHFAKKYSGTITPIEAEENVNIWLLPFIRPIDVREYYPDFENGSYDEMMKTVIQHIDIDTKKTNILVAHQFVTCNGVNPERSESESASLGTMDNVDVSHFKDFDYVALGHIHKPQPMGRKSVRYSGSMLKYSFSEKNDKKSMVLLDIDGKNINIENIPYNFLRDMKEFIGTYDELIKLPKTDDYVRIVLKDENFITDVKHKLENTFTNIMEIVYDNAFNRENKTMQQIENIEKQTPLDLFKMFYETQNNRALNEKEEQIVSDIFEEMKEVK